MFQPRPENFLLQIARQAAERLYCHAETLTFIQHSENVTFQVQQANGKPALLRLHVPLVPEFGTHGQHPEMIQSELDWLAALHAEGLPVPRPLHAPVRLHIPGQGVVYATLLEWLDGHIYHGRLRYHQVQNIGELVGKVHMHGLHWKRPPGFARPRLGLERYQAALKAIMPLQSDGRLTAADVAPLQTILMQLEDLLQSITLPQGLLHGDLYRGNFLWQGEHPALIDFSMCGEGYLLYDLAACLEHIPQKHHNTFWTAYRKQIPISPEHQQLLPFFYIANGLVSLAIWVRHPPSQEALIQRLGTLARAATEHLRRW